MSERRHVLRRLSCLRRRMIYNMCTQKPPHDYSEQLYSRYRDAFNIYINETVRGQYAFSLFGCVG